MRLARGFPLIMWRSLRLAIIDLMVCSLDSSFICVVPINLKVVHAIRLRGGFGIFPLLLVLFVIIII